MKILVVGDFHSDIYEKAIYNAFASLNYPVYKFEWFPYFNNYQLYWEKGKANNRLLSLYYRLQNKLLLGPVLNKINNDLLKYISEINPDLVFIYRGTHIFQNTIRKIKKNGAKVFAYNNDDPFASGGTWLYQRHYLNSLKYCDHVFAYRHKNILDYKRRGVFCTSLLRSYYIASRNYCIDISNNKYACDVSFSGHYEDDGRDEIIVRLINKGLNFKLFGGFWENSKQYDYISNHLGSIEFLRDDYNIAINNSKIALVFLSKLNSDSYTRRCFEIPATKTFMLCEYTEDMASLFKEGVEAEYFRDGDELIRKVNYYISNSELRKTIAENGYNRLMKDGHEVRDRAEQIIETYDRLRDKIT